MKAYAYEKAHDINNFSIKSIVLDTPVPGPTDLLIRIKSISFNPVDAKIRRTRSSSSGQPLVLGWDAAGVIEKAGSETVGYSVGDEVYYAGDLNRQGSNAEFQIIDYRLIAKKPANLTFSESAALPLTALTAWEALFERGFEYTKKTTVLIIGGAGGVGSMAIQLLKTLTDAKVIVTASRPETKEWCRRMGADYIIGRNIKEDLEKISIPHVDIVFGTTHTGEYLEPIYDILRPFGHLVLIDNPEKLDIVPFKTKALSVHWEFMFAKSLFAYQPEEQGRFLQNLSTLVEQGKIQSTLNQVFPNSPDSVRQAHEILEKGSAIGKIIMEW
jgi:zinc-binding alcohol dehydrogenase family protein